MFCTSKASFYKLGATLYLHVLTTARLSKYITIGANLPLASLRTALYIVIIFVLKTSVLIRGFNLTLNGQGTLGYLFTYNYLSWFPCFDPFIYNNLTFIGRVSSIWKCSIFAFSLSLIAF